MKHCSEARGGAVLLRDMDLPPQRLLRGDPMCHTDRDIGLKFRSPLIFVRRSDLQKKCRNANGDHSAHCVKANRLTTKKGRQDLR